MDKRKDNGGHSTKAKGVDKRKNQYKDALSLAGDVESVSKVLEMLYSKAVDKKDTNAAKIYLAYYLGNPQQSIEQNNTHTMNDFNIKDLLKFDNPKP